eukprot:scaffold1380_cov161-Amphora_coffeaeformis.AAC.7
MAEKKLLYDAIESNNDALVTKYLKKDAFDPNMNIADCIPNRNCLSALTAFVSCSQPNGSFDIFTPLHLAVVNAFHRRHQMGRSTDLLSSTTILLCLIECGAKTTTICKGTFLAGDLDPGRVYDSSPIALASFLGVSRCVSTHSSVRTLLTAVSIMCRGLQQMEHSAAAEKNQRSMLLSDEFSDIKVSCSDKVVLPAHRCILAASCPYWETALEGPWTENTSGIWSTTHTSTVMKEVLSYIYTGKIDPEILQKRSHGHLGSGK